MDDQQVAPQTNPEAAPAAAPASVIPTVPSSWPGAFGVYKHSKQAVKVNLVTIIVLWVISVLVSTLSTSLFGDTWGQLVSFIVSALFSASLVLAYLAGVRGQKMSIGDSITQAVPFWLPMIGLSILLMVALGLSVILLIIPFFFVLPRVILAEYYLVDKKMGIIDAFKASWDESKGHAGKVYGIFGATILMALLMVTIIGIPFSIYFLIMYSAATVILYEFINKSAPAGVPQPAPTVAPTAPPAAPQV